MRIEIMTAKCHTICKLETVRNVVEHQIKSVPTKRAPDAGESGVIPSIFLRLSIFPVGRRPAARPSAGNANRWQELALNL